MKQQLVNLVENYDSEQDPNGAIGIALADASFASVNYDLDKIRSIQEAVRTALRRFPELEKRESISVREIKRRLSEIRDTGYPTEHYSNMNKEQAWNYLMQLKREIRGEAEIFCHLTLKEIDERNRQAKENMY